MNTKKTNTDIARNTPMQTALGQFAAWLSGFTLIVDGILAVISLGYWQGPIITKELLAMFTKSQKR